MMIGIKLMKKNVIIKFMTLVILIFTSVLSADNPHGKQGDNNHVCFGLGIHGGLYRGGLQTRLWVNDIVGLSVKAYGDWSLVGGGGLGEFMFKPPF